MQSVAIQGNIGCGKSSLLRQLAKVHHANSPTTAIVQEPVSEWQGWLELYYERLARGSPDLPALQIQLQVLASLHRRFKALPRSTALAIFERSPMSSRQLFVARMVEKGELSEMDRKLYDEIFAHMGWTADLDVYIRCSPETCLRRIQQRARPGEATITLEYLRELHDKHETIYGRTAAVILDGEQGTSSLASQLQAALRAKGYPGPAADNVRV